MAWKDKWRSALAEMEGTTEPSVPASTPLRGVKTGLIRLLRVYTRTQTQFNRSTGAALRALNDGIDELRAFRHDTEASLKQLNERFEWLTRWTDGFRQELFFEVRHRLEEQDRLTNPEVMDSQTYKLKIQKMPDGLRVNLGAGHLPKSDYVNVDSRPLEGVDIRADVRHMPFEEGTLGELYSSHVIEHFPDAEMRSRILPYWHTLLRPGGRLVVICPNAEAMMKRWAQGQCSYEDLREVMFGGQEYEGNAHLNMFTPDSLEQMLKTASFRDIHRIELARPNGKCLEMELIAFR